MRLSLGICRNALYKDCERIMMSRYTGPFLVLVASCHLILSTVGWQVFSREFRYQNASGIFPRRQTTKLLKGWWILPRKRLRSRHQSLQPSFRHSKSAPDCAERSGQAEVRRVL